MNDNLTFEMQFLQQQQQIRSAQKEQVRFCREMAGRAVVRPESLTMGEIQEVGFGFLVALKQLYRLGVLD